MTLLSCWERVVFCIFIPAVFLFFIHVFDWKGNNRNSRSSVSKRFLGAVVACTVMYLFMPDKIDFMKFRFDGFGPAVFYPAVLTTILFLGPIVLDLQNQLWLYSSFSFEFCTDAVWIRNHILAPLTEEFAFRGCMITLLQPCSVNVVFVAPLFFSLVHYHHVFYYLRQQFALRDALLNCTLQAMYTYVFGVYASFLYLRTGHLTAPIVAHAICNHMGLPNVMDVGNYFGIRRLLLIASFIVGFTAWLLLLYPLTEKSLY